MQDPPLYNTEQSLSTGPQASTGSTAQLPTGPQQPTSPQQPTGPQQPIQKQNTAGPEQTFLPLQAYPPPVYYVGSDPMNVAYPNFPLRPYVTMPQSGGAVLYHTGQQPMAIQQLLQPIGTVSSTTVVKQSSGDHYKTLSVVMTILVLILGGWPSVMCTMAALMISYNARGEERRGNIAVAKTKAKISLGLNIAAVVFTMMVWSAVAIPVAVTVSAAKSTTIPPISSVPTSSVPTSSPYTTLPTPDCYATVSPLHYCYSTYCSYGYYYNCAYSSYYSYSDSYSYYSYSYASYYNLYCYANYHLACSYG